MVFAFSVLVGSLLLALSVASESEESCSGASERGFPGAATAEEELHPDSGSLIQTRSLGSAPCNYKITAYCGPWWLTRCELVPHGIGEMSGAFFSDVKISPPPTGGDPADNYVILGGQDVVFSSGQTLPTAETVYDWMLTDRADNVNFDMAGILADKYTEVVKLSAGIKDLRASNNKDHGKAQMTLQANSSFASAAGVASSFDTVGIMLYNVSMTGPGFSIPEGNPKSGKTYALLLKFLKTGIPKSKVVLGMTVVGLEAYMVDFFKHLVAENGFAGIMFWEIQNLPSSIPLSCITNPNERCGSSPSPPTNSTCRNHCAPQSSMAGECCELVSTTPMGSCFALGPEGCCGGGGLPPYSCLPDSVLETANVLPALDSDVITTGGHALLQRDAGVVQAYCGPSWLCDCSLVPHGVVQMVGAYSTSIDTPPDRAGGERADNYIVMGGQNVGIGQMIPSTATVAGWMGDSNADNINIDMEGIFAGQFSAAKSLADGIKSLIPGAKAELTCLAGDFDSAATVASSFDTVGIMLYANEMTGEGFSIPQGDPKSGQTYALIQKWLQAGIPASKIVLGMTTAGLQGYMVDFFKLLVAENGFAGIAFWKVQYLQADNIPVSCVTDATESCGSSPGPAPPPPGTCAARCAPASPVANDCCSKGSTTRFGSCTEIGEEACCGRDASGAPWWCLALR